MTAEEGIRLAWESAAEYAQTNYKVYEEQGDVLVLVQTVPFNLVEKFGNYLIIDARLHDSGILEYTVYNDIEVTLTGLPEEYDTMAFP